MHPDQTVSEIAREVIRRRASTLAGDYGGWKAAESQTSLPRARAEVRHYSWLESYMEWLGGKERRSEYHAFLEGELSNLRG